MVAPMSAPEPRSLVVETREVLEEARRLVRGRAEGPLRIDTGRGDSEGVLGLYDALCRRLGAIEDDGLERLLARVGEQIARLGQLQADIDRIRRLREAFRTL